MSNFTFNFELGHFEFELVNALGQFTEFVEQPLDLDLDQFGLDLVGQVVVWLGLDQAGSAEKQCGQGQPGDGGGGCLFFHYFTG